MIDPTLQTVTLGTAAIGAVAGLVGTFAVVRRQSLQGDAISHAALPGVSLAFLLGGRSVDFILLGAAATGLLAMLTVSVIVRNSRLSFDVVLGGVLAAYFGFGITLLEYVKRNVSGATQHGLDRYLFGQAAMMRNDDVEAILALGGVIIAVLLVFWKPIQLVAFDADFAHTLGFSVQRIDALLAALLVAAVVIGLQAIGVVLMSALIVAPAVAARQWTSRLSTLVLLAAFLGALAGVGGTLLSHGLSDDSLRIPTGPTIVLVVTAMVAISLGLNIWRST